jgi:hypothetical protein
MSNELLSHADDGICQHLVHILPYLLTPYSNKIKEATGKFKEISRNPAFIPSLTKVITDSGTDPNTRKLAAVLFRKRVVKEWRKSEHKAIMRTACLDFVQHADESIFKHMAEVVAGIAEHELQTEWADLWNLIAAYLAPNSSYGDRVKGSELLKCVCQTSVEPIFEKEQVMPVLKMINDELARPDVNAGCSDKGISTHKNAIDAFNAVSVFFGEDQKEPVRAMLPRIVQVIHELIQWDESIGSDAMSMITNLCETEDVKLVNNTIAIKMAEVAVAVAAQGNYEEETRANALSQLQMVIKYKKHAFCNNDLLVQLVNGMIL